MPRNPLDTIPEPIRTFFTITEVDDAEFFAGALFRRKFHAPPPDFPRHLVAFYRSGDGGLHPAGFSHMRPFGDVYLEAGIRHIGMYRESTGVAALPSML